MRYTHLMIRQFLTKEIAAGDLMGWLETLGLNPAVVSSADGDTVFELEIPANRGDLLSLAGIAREVTPFADCVLRDEPAAFSEASDESFPITIEDATDCPYYSCRIIRSVPVRPSPPEILACMERLGYRPANNVVDISNLVLARYGQPLHVFDLDTLEGEIVVRRARHGETIITIDGRKRDLDEGVLVIADRKKPVAIAGIMGGVNTEVSGKTANILIESALFNPRTVRRGSRRLGLSSEASSRFEKGLDIYRVKEGMNRITAEIMRICGGKTAALSENEFHATKPRPVSLRRDGITACLGTAIPDDFIEQLFSKRGFSCVRTDRTFLVTAPEFRNDIGEERDLVEEIAKYWGYQNLPSELPAVSLAPSPSPALFGTMETIRSLLAGMGFVETVSLGLLAEETARNIGIPCVPIENPLSKNFSHLRPTLLAGLLETAAFNVARQNDELSLFEIGTTFHPEKDGPREENSLGMLLLGTGDFFSLKGAVESFCSHAGIPPMPWEPAAHPLAQKGGALRMLYNGEPAGWALIPSATVVKMCDLKSDRVFLAELSLTRLFPALFPKRTFVELPHFPSGKRDFSLLFKTTVAWNTVADEIKHLDLPVEDLIVFDVFSGENLPPGMISVNFSVSYRTADRTLTSEEIDEYGTRIVSALSHKFGAVLRQ